MVREDLEIAEGESHSIQLEKEESESVFIGVDVLAGGKGMTQMLVSRGKHGELCGKCP